MSERLMADAIAIAMCSCVLACPASAQDSARIVKQSAELTAAYQRMLRQQTVSQMHDLAALAAATKLSAMLRAQVNEDHDAQRFYVGPNYGPKIYVIPSDLLGSLTTINQWNRFREYGAHVATIRVKARIGTVLPTPYKELKLQPGNNCLYLAHQGANEATGWTSYVVPVDDPRNCQQPVDASGLLTATFYRGADTDPADYPAVTRFDESDAGAPLIGVRCMNAWCDIGYGSFTVRKPSHQADPKVPNRREFRVRGWHDDQVLAVFDDNTASLKPKLRATVTPDYDLVNRPFDHYDGSFRSVATIWFEDKTDDTPYADSWGMKKGFNELQLHHIGGKNWEARVRPTGGSWTILLVDYMKHEQQFIPGTARFHWNDGGSLAQNALLASVISEGVWVPCDQGCCQVDAGFSFTAAAALLQKRSRKP